MKNPQKVRLILFALAGLSLLLSLYFWGYEIGYDRGCAVSARPSTVVTIRRSPAYTGDIRTQLYHGYWCTHEVDPYYAIHFEKPDVAEALGYETCYNV